MPTFSPRALKVNLDLTSLLDNEDKKSKNKRGVLPKHATNIMRSWLFQHLMVSVCMLGTLGSRGHGLRETLWDGEVTFQRGEVTREGPVGLEAGRLSLVLAAASSKKEAGVGNDIKEGVGRRYSEET